MTWVRVTALAAFSWHAVSDTVGGSVVTLCRGRWSVAEPYQTEERPPIADRCAACQRAVVDQQPMDLRLKRALVEPVTA